jgi:4-hydroxy-tetrahydrodipicolinate synthase
MAVFPLREYDPGVLGEILTAIVTPLKPDGTIDLDRFRALAAYLVENGSDGLVVTRTTGESPTLSDDERFALYEAAVDEIGDRATVVAGTGTYSTAHSVHLTERAHDIGVDGFLVVTPYYSKPPVRGIVEHFRAIAAASDRPIVVYNIPQRVVVNIEPETIVELSRIPNVRAVKQATTDIEQARRIVEEAGLELLAGNDDLILPFLDVGAVGGIFVFSHLVGAQVKELITRWNEGDRDGARALGATLQPVIDALAVTTNPIPVKAALAMMGRIDPEIRPPLYPMASAAREKLRTALADLGLV